jgi:hypothetical protein
VTLLELFETIVTDPAAASRSIKARPAFANEQLVVGASRQAAASYFLDEIRHYVYAGDTALHVSAAAYRPALRTGIRPRRWRPSRR